MIYSNMIILGSNSYNIELHGLQSILYMLCHFGPHNPERWDVVTVPVSQMRKLGPRERYLYQDFELRSYSKIQGASYNTLVHLLGVGSKAFRLESMPS